MKTKQHPALKAFLAGLPEGYREDASGHELLHAYGAAICSVSGHDHLTVTPNDLGDGEGDVVISWFIDDNFGYILYCSMERNVSWLASCTEQELAKAISDDADIVRWNLGRAEAIQRTTKGKLPPAPSCLTEHAVNPRPY